jgi:MYXO-CTERM domain-containing protein
MSVVTVLERRLALGVCIGLSSVVLSAPAHAAIYSYVDWSTADVASGSASGTITLPDSSTVTVTFAAINADSSPGTLYGAQVNGGTNYWSPSTPYTSVEVENAPPTPDILQLSGGLNQTYVVTLSEPIKDPMMAVVSLGQGSLRTTYDFDAPFTIVSQGAGYWGGGPAALTALPDDILEGYEGHGTIRFVGTFETFSWTAPTPETWHGFTFAIRTTERLEPTPGAGGAGGASAGGADDGSGLGGVDAGGADARGVDAGGTGGADGGDDGVGGTGAGVAGDSAVAGGESVGIGEGGAGRGGTSSSGGAADGDGGDPDGSERSRSRDEGGCGCSVPRGKGWGTGLAVALALLVLRRRRR